jgi:hypothetical protein
MTVMIMIGMMMRQCVLRNLFMSLF